MRAKFYIADLRAKRAENVDIFSNFCPPPPSEKWIDAPVCVGGGGGVRACVRARVCVWCSVSWYVCACSREKSQRQIAIIPPTPQNGFTPL